MGKLDNRGFILQKLLFVLSSMNPIIVKEDPEASGIYKNDILFCLVNENNIYFNPGKYYDSYFMNQTIKLPFRKLRNIDTILQDKIERHDIDQILQYATESYWLMSGLKKSSKNLYFR